MKNVTMPGLCSSLLLNVQVNNGSLKKLSFSSCIGISHPTTRSFPLYCQNFLKYFFFYIKEGSKSTSLNILDSIDLLLKKNTCM